MGWESAGKKERLSPEELEKLREKRLHIVKELLSTENSYLKALWSIQINWEEPLRMRGILNDEDLKELFSTSKVLLNIHEVFCADIEGRVRGWNDDSLIGDLFVKQAPILKLYTEFVNNYDHASDLLDEYAKQKDFKDFLASKEGNVTPMSLRSLLIQPIQRLPRYSMLLADLTKNTWESHKDVLNLQLALKKINETTDYVNEAKRKAESDYRLLKLHNLMPKLNLFQPHRRVIHEQSFNLQIKKASDKKKSIPKAEKAKPCKFILMNDSILLLSILGDGKESVNIFSEIALVTPAGVDNEEVFQIASESLDMFFFPSDEPSNGAKSIPDFLELVISTRLEHKKKYINRPENDYTFFASGNKRAKRYSLSPDKLEKPFLKPPKESKRRISITNGSPRKQSEHEKEKVKEKEKGGDKIKPILALSNKDSDKSSSSPDKRKAEKEKNKDEGKSKNSPEKKSPKNKDKDKEKRSNAKSSPKHAKKEQGKKTIQTNTKKKEKKGEKAETTGPSWLNW